MRACLLRTLGIRSEMHFGYVYRFACSMTSRVMAIPLLDGGVRTISHLERKEGVVAIATGVAFASDYSGEQS